MTHIVGIIGRKFSGKSTAAGTLAEQNGFTVVKFADPLKEMIRTLFYVAGYDEHETEEYIEGSLKEAPVDILGGKSTRHAMQTLGTEWGRTCIGDEFWTTLFLARASQRRLVVCDDCRFENEANLIADQGGVLIRLLRPEQAVSGPEPDRHPSEIEMDNISCHHFIYNDGSIMDLYKKVKSVAFDRTAERLTLEEFYKR